MSLKNSHCREKGQGEFPATIMDHYEDPFHQGICPGATHAAEGTSEAGCVIRFEARCDDDGVLEALWFDGDGCIPSQAVASMLVEHVLELAEEQRLGATEIDELPIDSILLGRFGGALSEQQERCVQASVRAFRETLHHPIDPDLDDSERHTFGGPDLGDEC